MDKPINPPTISGSPPGALPALVSNGVIGLRVREIPVFAGVAVVNGLSGTHPVTQVEATAHAPYPLGSDIWINRVKLSDVQHQITAVEQAYDFSCGELHTTFAFEMDDVQARVEVLTLCSRSRPTLVMQELKITVNRPCKLTLRAIIDPRQIHGRWLKRFTGTPGAADSVDGSLCWETLGALSRYGVAYVTELTGVDHPKCTREEWGEQSPLATAYVIDAEPGKPYTLHQIASLVPSHLHHEPDRQATRIAAHAKSIGFDTLREQNRAVWSELWKGRVRLVGAPSRWQALADAAFFYLNSCSHECAPASTGIFGLAEWHDYHYYYGHIMWDLETFVVPPLLLSQPYAARAILDYRSSFLSAARANARLNGYRGTQFPWESGNTHGEESAPGPGTAAWHEDHISADVALAFAHYVHATGDEEFFRDQAWPVLHGVADWIVSRVARRADGFDLRQSMGVAERKSPSDNPAFPLMGMKLVLREALAAAGKMQFPQPPEWASVEAGLRLPTNASTGAVVSYEGFKRSHEKSATPDPLAGMFSLGFELDRQTEAATLEYYLERAEEYIGSPMLSALYGVWASWAGDRELAATLLDKGYAQFTSDRFLQTLEYRPDKFPEEQHAGPFMANVGAFLSGCLYGLPGLRLGPDAPETWPRRRVVLPAGWKAIEVDRIWIRGQPARLIARHGDDRARIERGADGVLTANEGAA